MNSTIAFDRRGMARPALTIRPYQPPAGQKGQPQATRHVAGAHPAVAVLGRVSETDATLRSLMFVLEDGFLLDMPLSAKTIRQLRETLGEPELSDDPELAKPGWA